MSMDVSIAALNRIKDKEHRLKQGMQRQSAP